MSELEAERLRSVIAALCVIRVTPRTARRRSEKARERSQGKFYADGWSTARHRP